MEKTAKKPGRPMVDNDLDNYPNQARKFRLQCGLTSRQVAERIGTIHCAVLAFERTGHKLGRIKVYKLARALGVGVGELLTPGEKYAKKVYESLP